MRFLLFDPHTPRSIQCGLTRMLSYLDRLPGGCDSKAARIAGHLRAKMTYEDEQILSKPDLTEFFEEAAHAIGAIHEALERAYFSV